ncbi:hypothetical protein [Paracraurococcus lichenis]|uniref:Uncharacterized protein n=1 Tax=Paracraurococcus lichenis TaxID=3064888 RepID=A0ABT9DXE1_9PROT|nr:hypothetical protein [Paracraurococcus sp. LOR1-02]MDO9708566.1 hypothetical protein [Paracraurococcus sp. LOR1-02]
MRRISARPKGVLLALVLLALAGAAGAAPAGRSRPDAAAIEAARRFLCPHGGMPVRGRGGLCRPGTGAAPGGSLGGTEVRGWDLGLPAPAHRQAPCPAGTKPMAAIARPEAVRCVPE